MITDRLALSRVTTDRDAERRETPGLLTELVRDPSTRLLLVDTRGRVALGGHGTGRIGEASKAGQPSRAKGAAERWARETGWDARHPHPADHLPHIRATDLEERDLEGLTTAYLGCDADGTEGAGGHEPVMGVPKPPASFRASAACRVPMMPVSGAKTPIWLQRVSSMLSPSGNRQW